MSCLDVGVIMPCALDHSCFFVAVLAVDHNCENYRDRDRCLVIASVNYSMSASVVTDFDSAVLLQGALDSVSAVV